VIDEGLPRIAMPAHRFTQMVYNLVLNAADAMRNAKPGGKVTINIHRCKASPGSSDDSQTTEMVQVEVQDQGVGMSDEVKARCMEPFFTTKTRGISTGLGLALVHGAVQKAGGTIELESRVGWGTRFVLTIPAVANEQSRAQPLRRILVCVQVRDIRMRAYVVSVLEPLQVDVITSMTGGAIGQGGSDAAELIVCDEREQVHIWQALEQRAETRAVILRSSSAGEVHVPPAFDHRVATWTQGNSSQLRDIVQQMIAAIRNRDAQESSERGEHVRLAEADRGHAGARSGQIGSAGGGASGLIVSHQLVG
jgi:anti-sigma regulatory factor (Ser/Thr protein kinase)